MNHFTIKKMKSIIHTLLLIAIVFLSACKKDKNDVATPPNTNETEIITSVKLLVTNNSSHVEKSFSFRDLDGDGGNNPTIDTIRLNANAEYSVALLVLDESKTPTDTTSIEIKEEKNMHQFFYRKDGAYDLTTTYLDFDDHNVPLGLSVRFTTGSAFSIKTNKLRVTLKHQPEIKPTSGNGDVRLGETDIDVYFPILVQ